MDLVNLLPLRLCARMKWLARLSLRGIYAFRLELFTLPKNFKKALAFYFASDSLRAPRRPEGRQDSMFADR
jgi:hypothetical protein